MVGTGCQVPDNPPAAPGWREEPPRLIAHGGGALGDVHVTNSLQALDHAAAEEFLLIEVDLCWTSDGDLVLLHDWDGAFTALFGLEPGPRSLDAFLALQSLRGLQQLGLDGLEAWMKEHPHIGIVTDIKAERMRGLELLSERLAAVRDQLVPQVHGMDEAQRARSLGFKSVILTLYASQFTDDEVLDLVDRESFYAVTIPKDRALSGLARRLTDAGFTTYAHTVNNHLMATQLAHAGVHGVYTDRLTPARSRQDAVPEEETWVIHKLHQEGGSEEDRSILIVDLRDVLDPRCGTLAVQHKTGGGESVSLDAFTADGERMDVIQVAPGPQAIPLASLFPEELPAWISAPSDVALELRWDLLDRPALVRRSSAGVPAAWRARGPADGLEGIGLFLLNPGSETRTVELRLGGKVVSRQVEAGSILVERTPIRQKSDDFEISVAGGGVIVHLLRVGPDCSMIR